jgi:hypothetical protein
VSRRELTTLAVSWVTICVIAAVSVLSSRNTDGAAGFIIAMLVLQAPAFIALAGARDDITPSAGRCAAIAIPAALVAGFTGFFVSGHGLARLVPPSGSWLIVVALGVLGGIVAGGLPLGRYLAQQAHPAGARRALTVFALVNAAGSAVAVACSYVRHPEFLIVMLLPGAWAVPLIVACRRKPPGPPIARVVR